MMNERGAHQWLPGFATGDAISNCAITLQKIIRGWGIKSEIFCPARHVSQDVRPLCKDWETYYEYSAKDNTVIYHFSIGSSLSDKFKKIPDKKALIYHNITPERYFRSINPEKALALYNGRQELAALRDVPQLSLAVSEFNRLELEEWGYKNTAVIPQLVNYDTLKSGPEKSILNKYNDDWTNILFVGRITPNKKIEDVIRTFYYFKKSINPKSRLFIVGSFDGVHKYMEYLRALTLELALSHVVFPGHVTNSELIAYYKLSDLFLCMSEHEGFCIPLIESMYFDVPVIAFSGSAIPYTVGRSGVLIDKKDFPDIAELINMVLTNEPIRRNIIEGQKKRLKDFSMENISREIHSRLYNFIFS